MSALAETLAVCRPGARPEAFARKSFSAWRVSATNAQSYPVAAEGDTLDAFASDAAARCAHKDGLFVRETDNISRTVRLHIYAIKRKSTPRYTGHFGADRAHDLYHERLYSVAVDEFVPTRPFDAFRDDPVGPALGYVEGRAL